MTKPTFKDMPHGRTRVMMKSSAQTFSSNNFTNKTATFVKVCSVKSFKAFCNFLKCYQNMDDMASSMASIFSSNYAYEYAPSSYNTNDTKLNFAVAFKSSSSTAWGQPQA